MLLYFSSSSLYFFINLLGIHLFLFLVSCISLPYTCIPSQSFFLKQIFNSWAFVLFCLLPLFPSRVRSFSVFPFHLSSFHLSCHLCHNSLLPLCFFLFHEIRWRTLITITSHIDFWFSLTFSLQPLGFSCLFFCSPSSSFSIPPFYCTTHNFYDSAPSRPHLNEFK